MRFAIDSGPTRSGHSSDIIGHEANVAFWPASVRSPTMLPSDLGLLRHLKGVVDFNAEVAHCTFQLGMSEQ